jgi:hypothetical protein
MTAQPRRTFTIELVDDFWHVECDGTLISTHSLRADADASVKRYNRLVPPMNRWCVQTRATVTRTYFVDAPDEKSAEEASSWISPEHEEDTGEETLAIELLPITAGMIASRKG